VSGRSHRTTALGAAALLVSLSSIAAAQACLGVPNAKKHTLGVIYSGSRGAEGDDGGGGLTYGATTANGSSARVEFVVRPIVLDNSGSSVEDFNVTRIAGTMARPLSAPKTTGTMTSGFCGMAQLATAITSSASSEDLLGRAPSPTSTAYSAAGGAAWSVSSPSSAFYAGPLFGVSSANDETALFTTLVAGGGIRAGRLLLNLDLNMPVGVEDAKTSFDFRLGYMW
jgi:hypothetical protein